LNNTLIGTAGNDTLDGGAGPDYLAGGAGDDTYIIDDPGDVVVELPGQGAADRMVSRVSIRIAPNVEILQLAGTASLTAWGSDGNDTLIGNAGDNVLLGMGGADTMIGGAGNDIYAVDNPGDVIIEQPGEGIDRVGSYLQSYTLPANVEIGVIGLSSGAKLDGNALDNTLYGGVGDDTLAGGLGNDTTAGGAGNDTYIVDSTGDVVIENPGDGVDWILASVSYTLAANVEVLQLTGTGDLMATGTAGNDTLIGNSGNNVLDGLAGADTLIGGGGNDTYYVDNLGDVVIETSGQGTADRVITTVDNYRMPANVEILQAGGTANLTLWGSAGVDTLIGNAGHNVLVGLGGGDTMIGGAGNDIYGIYDSRDVVIEDPNGGIDWVGSYLAAYTLAANVELGSIGLVGGAALTGNALSNTLYGNVGNDTLDGGAGNDSLAGGAGDDLYIVRFGRRRRRRTRGRGL